MDVIEIKARKKKPHKKESDIKAAELTVKVVYAKDGSNGLPEARRLLAKKILEANQKQCAQQSTSE